MDDEMIIVGLGRSLHDCSIAVSVDGKFFKYAKFEREYQIKHGQADEWWAWKKLTDWGIRLDSIDYLIYTDSGGILQNRKTENSIEKIRILPLNGEDYIRKSQNYSRTKTYLMDHHLAHAWSNTKYNKDKVAVIADGAGSGPWTNMVRKPGYLHRGKEFSAGHMFTYIGGMMNITPNGPQQDNAGKIMGLIPYAESHESLYEASKEMTLFEFKEIMQNLSIKKSVDSKEWLRYIWVANELCYDYILELFNKAGKDQVVHYAGGCALNVDWNRRLTEAGWNIEVEPPVYDGGLSIGCLRYGHSIAGIEPPAIENYPYIQDDEVPSSRPLTKTIKDIAEKLAQGKIVGWYQGNGELGPRALGNRSILMDPNIKDGKDILNKRVKFRESWRPYGASVKEESATKYFDFAFSPYMLYTAQVTCSGLDSVRHVDNTCRHQTVNPHQNEVFYELLDEYERLTGCSVLLNTSLNSRGKPLAASISDAKSILDTTDMDILCVGNDIYNKGV